MERQTIEFEGVPVGIVVPDEGRLKFIAVKFHVIGLDGQYFHNPEEVRSAIGRLLGKQVRQTHVA